MLCSQTGWPSRTTFAHPHLAHPPHASLHSTHTPPSVPRYCCSHSHTHSLLPPRPPTITSPPILSLTTRINQHTSTLALPLIHPSLTHPQSDLPYPVVLSIILALAAGRSKKQQQQHSIEAGVAASLKAGSNIYLRVLAQSTPHSLNAINNSVTVKPDVRDEQPAICGILRLPILLWNLTDPTLLT